jgi:phage-related protein
MHSNSHIAVNCLLTAAPHHTQQLPDSIADKIPESAIAEHTAKVTSALKGLTGSTLAAGDAPVTSSATSTATGGTSSGSSVAAEVQKQIDAGAAAVTTGITTQITGLTGKVYNYTSTLLHCVASPF